MKSDFRCTSNHCAAHQECRNVDDCSGNFPKPIPQLREEPSKLEGRTPHNHSNYDPECYNLAWYFLGENGVEKKADSLATAIQDAVEDWFYAEEKKNV